MRFTGRIRFDEVGDVDVTVEVSDTHVRLASGDESLGSWCLADVVANRLLADQFEIDLDGEVITFVADDQVGFAYGAVQSMAEGWARYHAMNLLRRKRAVAGARRRNEPHRLDAVRRAFVGARSELQRTPSGVVRSAMPDTAPAGPVESPPVELGTAGLAEPAAEGAPAGLWERVERAAAADEASDTHGRGADDELLAGRPEPDPAPAEAPGEPDPTPEPADPPPVEVAPAPVREENGHLDEPRTAVIGSYRDGHHPAETSGLRASLRSFMSRSRDPHEHSFVESTTAVGITRRVCLECGHVSIGVAE